MSNRRKPKNKLNIISSIREIVFGVEDGLVSTLGAITGIAAGTGSSRVVVISGVVIVIVEAISMGAGSYLSSKSARAAMEAKLSKKPELKQEIQEFFPKTHGRSAGVMWASYTVAGFVPVLPYIFLPINQSYLPSIVLTGMVLFLLGVWKARVVGESRLRSGLEMLVIAFSAAVIGFGVGHLVGYFFGV